MCEDKRDAGSPQANRSGIINAVNTPLGFFVLVVLVSEALLALTVPWVEAEIKKIVVIAIIILIAILVIFVGLMAIFRPEALQGRTRKSTLPGKQNPRRGSKGVDLILGGGGGLLVEAGEG